MDGFLLTLVVIILLAVLYLCCFWLPSWIFKKRYAKFVGMKGFLCTQNGRFVNLQKKPVAGLEKYEFPHPFFLPEKVEYLPCTLTRLQFGQIIYEVRDFYATFRVTNIGEENVILYNDEYGTVMKLISEFTQKLSLNEKVVMRGCCYHPLECDECVNFTWEEA